MEAIHLKKRDPSLKAKQLRRFGIVPCVVNGKQPPLTVQLDQTTARQLQRTYREGSRILLEFEGETISTTLVSLERNDMEVVSITFQVIPGGTAAQ